MSLKDRKHSERSPHFFRYWLKPGWANPVPEGEAQAGFSILQTTLSPDVLLPLAKAIPTWYDKKTPLELALGDWICPSLSETYAIMNVVLFHLETWNAHFSLNTSYIYFCGYLCSLKAPTSHPIKRGSLSCEMWEAALNRWLLVLLVELCLSMLTNPSEYYWM